MSGERYELRTLCEVVNLACKLPADRREVLVREIGEAIQYAAAFGDLMGALGFEAAFDPLTWIDDDKGEKTINVQMADGEQVLSMEIKPA